MKKYLPHANLLTLGAGVLGMLLMLLLRAGGTDEKGLYPTAHPAWVLLWILTPVVLVLIWLLTRTAGSSRSYRGNFPASIPAAAGCLIAAAGLLICGIQTLDGGKPIHILCGTLGILSAIALLGAAWCRFRGRKCPLMPHALPCFFFAAQLFVLGQLLGAEPEACRYLFRFLAALAMLPACYWLWGFDVSMGNRQKCLFWCLAAGYLNLVAAGGAEQWLLHICMAVWLLSAVPALRYLPKKPRPAPVDTPPVQAVEPADPQEVDARLDQLLSELESDL